MIIDSPTYGVFNIFFDKDNYEKVKQHGWSISKCWNKKTNTEPKFYASSSIQVDSKQKGILMHRYLINAPKGKVVDHINGNTNDNRNSNLRICTQSQNRMNYTDKPSNNTSGYIGVSWCKRTNKWMAHLGLMGKFKNLGYYDNVEDAAQARIRGEEKYYKEYSGNKEDIKQ